MSSLGIFFIKQANSSSSSWGAFVTDFWQFFDQMTDWENKIKIYCKYVSSICEESDLSLFASTRGCYSLMSESFGSTRCWFDFTLMTYYIKHILQNTMSLCQKCWKNTSWHTQGILKHETEKLYKNITI